MNNPIKSTRQESGNRRSNQPECGAGWGRILSAALLACSLLPSTATAELAVSGINLRPSGKISADLQHVPSNRRITVIVQFKQRPEDKDLVGMKGRGAEVHAKLHSIPAVVMHIPASMLAELEKNPKVAYVTPDRAVAMTSTASDNEEFATAIEADVAAAQYGLDGTGVGVAVIDSGIAAHPDLNDANGKSRVVYSQSFVTGDASTNDKYGHGTHVSGLIGGSGANSGTGNGYAATYAGVAPNVSLINLRVLDQNGAATDSEVIAAIDKAIALANTYNIGVINLSLGRPVFESYTLDPVCQAVEAAWRAGIVVVVAAGNDGRDQSLGTHGFATIGAPANDPAVITVGAMRTMLTSTRVDDAIASYSSKGPTLLDHIAKPDLVAPGNRLVSLRAPGSTLDTEYPQFEVNPNSGNGLYYQMSGTSMATPLVTGTVALMLQENPALTPDQIKARLMKAAWKGAPTYSTAFDRFGNSYANEYDLFTYGAGYLDVNATLSNTDLATGVALSPTVSFNQNTGAVSLGPTPLSVVWGGTSVAWGANSVLWGNSVVWGRNTVDAESVVWGATSVVWGVTDISATSVVWGGAAVGESPVAAFSDSDGGDQ